MKILYDERLKSGTFFDIENEQYQKNGSYAFYNNNTIEKIEKSDSGKFENLTDGNHMFTNCSNLQLFDSQLDKLIDGSYMFYDCSKLSSFTGDLSSLKSGYGMFDNCILDFASVQNIADSINDISDDVDKTDVSNWRCGDRIISPKKRGVVNIGIDLNSDVNFQDYENLFYNISEKGWDLYLTFFEKSFVNFDDNGQIIDADLKLLKNGSDMFSYTLINDFDYDLFSLENGDRMFYSCGNLNVFDKDLKNLTTANDMFGCSGLVWAKMNWHNDSSLNDVVYLLNSGDKMFSQSKSLQACWINAPSLTISNELFNGCEKLKYYEGDIGSYVSDSVNGIGMFSGCKLSATSVKNILKDINDVSDVGGVITIGIDCPESGEGDVTRDKIANICGYDSWDELNQAFINKGWNVNWEYNGDYDSIFKYDDCDITTESNEFEIINSSYMTDLVEGDWTYSLSQLKNGNNLFNNSDELITFTTLLPNLKYGRGMFANSSIQNFGSVAPNLQNASMMFKNSNLSSFGGDFSTVMRADECFENCKNLTTFDSDLTSLSNGDKMFSECSNLTTFKSDLRNLKNGNKMFYKSGIKTYCIDMPILEYGQDMFSNSALQNFNGDLSKLKNGNCMFSQCESLLSFVSDLTELTNGISMFEGCHNINSFEIDLPKLVDGDNMFSGCGLNFFYPNLSNLISGVNMFRSNNFMEWNNDLVRLQNGSDMFIYCSKLESFNSDLSNLMNGKRMFNGCSKLTEFNNDMPRLINGQDMFKCCSSIASFDSDMPILSDSTCMFYYCSSLESFRSDLSSLTNGDSMFYRTNLASFDSDLPSLTNAESMFAGCNNLVSFGSDLPSLTNGTGMFYGSTKLNRFETDLSNLTNAESMFAGCNNLTSFISNLSNLTDGRYMFCGCGKLNHFEANLSNLRNGEEMFSLKSSPHNINEYCNLDKESVLYIIRQLKNDNTLNIGESGVLTMPIPNSLRKDVDILNEFGVMSLKTYNETTSNTNCIPLFVTIKSSYGGIWNITYGYEPQ